MDAHKEIIIGRTDRVEAESMIKELEFYNGWKFRKIHYFKNGKCIWSMER